MKLSMAAAAIAFSGTALFFAPAAASAAQQDAKPQATAKAGSTGGELVKAGWDGTSTNKAGSSGKSGSLTAKSETMDYDGMGGAFEEASLKGGDMGDMASKGETGSAKLASASTDGKFGMADMDTGAKFQTASLGKGEMSADMGGKGDMASAKHPGHHEATQPVETAAVTKDSVATGADIGQGKTGHTGMGGPEEAVTDYPPCRPGPGDDRCIQLYEVGASAKA